MPLVRNAIATEHIVAKHDDGDVDKIIGNQYGSQRALTVVTQHLNFAVTNVPLTIQCSEIGGRKTEKGYFGPARKSGNQQQKNRKKSCKDDT